IRRLPRHLERDPGAAHAADEPHQRHFERDHRRRHPRGRAHRRRLGLGARRHRGGACLGERRRRLPRDAAHAADVQEKAEMTANQLTLWYLIAAVNHPAAFGVPNPLPRGNKLELFIGTFVGAITFSGSVIAFGKLAGLGKKFRLFSSAPVVYPGQHWLNLVLGLAMIGFGVAFFLAADKLWAPFLAMTSIAFALGVLIIIPIGGAVMPVVISMLNSYSGWAAAGIGFSLNNAMLIIAGSLVGS